MPRTNISKKITATVKSAYGQRIKVFDTEIPHLNALEVKIEEAKKKRTGLIDLYTSGDIDKSEFTALRAKYDEEIKKLKSMTEGIEKQQEMIAKQQELLRDIKKAIEELISYNGIII